MERFTPKEPDNMTGGNKIPKKILKSNAPINKLKDANLPAKDGYDNTGTQGYDSLSDDGYQGNSADNTKGNASKTGSSSEDFNNP